MSDKRKILLGIFIVTVTSTSLIFASDISSLIRDLGNKEKAKDASVALAKIGEPSVPALIKALEGKNKYRKRYAARAIREMGQLGSKAIPALEKLLKDWDVPTREYVVEALGNMVLQAPQVLPILEKAKKDRSKDVAKKSKLAIEKIKAALTDGEKLAEIVKYRLNLNNVGKKCTSLVLEEESPNQYKGIAEFEDGLKSQVVVKVLGSKVQYSFGGELKTYVKKADGSLRKSVSQEGEKEREVEISELSTVPSGESNADNAENYLDQRNSTIKISKKQTKRSAVVTIICIITLITVIVIALTKTFDGTVTFFSSYLDLLASFFPLMALFISWLVVEYLFERDDIEIPDWAVLAAIIASISYNYTKAFYDNWHSKFLAFCVGTGRITVGYLLPFVIVFSAFEFFFPKGEYEKTSEWVDRKVRSGLILGAGLAFLHKLIGTHSPCGSYDEYGQYTDICERDAYFEDDVVLGAEYDDEFITIENPYDLLNVPQDATREEIKNAYRKLAHQYHPDKTAQLGPELQRLAHRKMQEINEAYELLMQEKDNAEITSNT